MPQCDSSQTGMRAVRPEPSPADLQPDWTAGVSEVSRFSCMKFLGVPWGLRPRRTEQKLALSLLSMLPSAHVNRVGVRVVSFRGSMATPPILYLRFAGSLAVAAQDSRPSGSLLLSCKALSSSPSCRLFRKHLPADCVGRGGLGAQPDRHRETETPKASQVMVSTTFPPPLFGCVFGAKKWHTSF